MRDDKPKDTPQYRLLRKKVERSNGTTTTYKTLIEQAREDLASGRTLRKTKVMAPSIHQQADIDLTPSFELDFGLPDLDDLLGPPKDIWGSSPTEMTPQEAVLSELKLNEAIDEAFSSGISVDPDLRIDDRDIKQFPNIAKWILEPDIEGVVTTPFPRQLEVMLKLMGEYCLTCTRKNWPSKKKAKAMGMAVDWTKTPALPVDMPMDQILDYVQLTDYGVCPKCKKTRAEMLKDGDVHIVQEANLCLGQRSGKSGTTYMTFPYVAHMWLKFPNANKYMPGVMATTPLSFTAVGLTYAKAVSLLWQPIHTAIARSSFFTEYHHMLRTYEEFYNAPGSLLKFKDTFVHWAHRNLFMNASGPNKRTLRGSTAWGGAIDELGLFFHGEASEDREKASAEEVYTSLANSMLTVRTETARLARSGFNHVPMSAYQMNISSPISYTDKMMTLVRDYKDHPSFVCMHLPTWEYNPFVPRDTPDIQIAYEKDYKKADRDFGANPPMSNNPWIADSAIIEMYHKQGKPNGVNYTYKTRRSNSGAEQKYAKIKTMRPPFENMPPCVMSIDGGFCMSGDTYIPTSKGILKIEDMGTHGSKKTSEDLKVKVGGQFTPSNTRKWYYSGKKQVLNIKTDIGVVLKPTPEHKVLSLHGLQCVWKKASTLRKGDYLVSNPKQVVRKTKYVLNLSDQLKTSEAGSKLGKKKNTLIKPKYMTPDLAWLIGCLISEGSHSKYYTGIAQCDQTYRDKLVDCYQKVFDLNPSTYQNITKGTPYNVMGITGIANKDCFTVHVCSVQLSKWWDELGLKHGAKEKVIPDCILQADYESQKAFLSAYIESDGSIQEDRLGIRIWSSSNEILDQMNILLNSHGIYSKTKALCLDIGTSIDAVKLYKEIEPHLTFKQDDRYLDGSNRRAYTYGLPEEVLDRVVDIIHYRQETKATNTTKGTYINDDGKEISLDVNPLRSLSGLKTFSYEGYDEGQYDSFLSLLKKISKEHHTELVTLLKAKYRFPQVTSKTKGKTVDVYDLTIEKGRDPSFTANGLVVHNSNNSFSITVGFVEKLQAKFRATVVVAVEIAPERNKNTLNFTRIYKDVILPLCKEYGVKLLLADRWNSRKILDDIEEDTGGATIGIQYSIRPDDFSWIYDHLTDENFLHLRLPRMEIPLKDLERIDIATYPHCFGPGNKMTGRPMPIAHLVHQFSTVELDSKGNVQKGPGYTDDLLRALTLMLKFLWDEEAIDEFKLLEGGTGRRSVAMGAVGNVYAGGKQATGKGGSSFGASSVGNGAAASNRSGAFSRS